MLTFLKIVTIAILALASSGGGPTGTSDPITPDRGCAPGDREACEADGGVWHPKTCTCE